MHQAEQQCWGDRQSPPLRLPIHTLAVTKTAGLYHKSNHELIEDGLLHVDSTRTKTYFPLVGEAGTNSLLNHLGNIDIFEHDAWVLASQLQHVRTHHNDADVHLKRCLFKVRRRQ